MAIGTRILDGTGTRRGARVLETGDGNALLVQVVTSLPATVTTGLAFGQANTGNTGNALIPLRSTVYTEQKTNGQRSVKSTNLNDTGIAPGGNGARSVQIIYYDQEMTGPYMENVVLNGTTAVATSNQNICFIESMFVIGVGSAQSNQGSISLFANNTGTGTIIGSIGVGDIVGSGAVGDNQTLWAHHYVKEGKTCTIFTISGGTSGSQSGVEFLRVTNPIDPTGVEKQITEALVVAFAQNSVFRVAGIPIRIPGPARITQYVVSTGTNTTFVGGFEFEDR